MTAKKERKERWIAVREKLLELASNYSEGNRSDSDNDSDSDSDSDNTNSNSSNKVKAAAITNAVWLQGDIPPPFLPQQLRSYIANTADRDISAEELDNIIRECFPYLYAHESL